LEYYGTKSTRRCYQYINRFNIGKLSYDAFVSSTEEDIYDSFRDDDEDMDDDF